jgi:putative hemolysin
MNLLFVELLVIAALILCNGFLALAEMSFVSSRKGRLEQRAARGSKGAAAALRVLENPTRFLSTIQVGISLIGILTGVFGGATIGEELARWFGMHGALAPFAETLSIVCVVVPVTYFSVVFGELVPKRLGLGNPEALASFLALPVQAMAAGFGPVVAVLGKSTDITLRLLGVRPADSAAMVEEEIRSLLREGTQSGAMDQVERQMVERVLRLGDQRAAAIMTPRTEIAWIDLDESPELQMAEVRLGNHSIYPAGRGSIDHVEGFVRSRDILARVLEGEAPDLQRLMTPASFLPDTVTALAVLNALKEKGHPAAFLIDEHGGLEGMITLSDVLEAIVGILPEQDARELGMVTVRGDGSLLIDGMLSADELRNLLEESSEEGHFSGHYHTLGGLVMKTLERVPVEGDMFVLGKHRFEVVDMDGNRVDKVLVSRVQDAAAAGKHADGEDA